MAGIVSNTQNDPRSNGRNLNGNINFGWGAPGFIAGTTDLDGDFDGDMDRDVAQNPIAGYNGNVPPQNRG